MKAFLKKLAIRHLGLVDEQNALVALESAEATKALTSKALDNRIRSLTSENVRLQCRVDSLERERERIVSKYPTVWLQGDAAQGVIQIPKLKMACEFFREENRLCVFAPWNDAAGRKPSDFVPPWLEVDETLQIECIMERMNSSGILYKIPIRGWDDTLTLTRTLEKDHPSYGLDGKPIEKARSFRNRKNINGIFKREFERDGDWCNVWYFEAEIGNHKLTDQERLPKGNLLVDDSRATEFHEYGSAPNRMFHWKIPVREIDLPVELPKDSIYQRKTLKDKSQHVSPMFFEQKTPKRIE